MIDQSPTYRLRSAVLAHATTNYEQGWDVIVEAYEPGELDALIAEVGGDDAATVINRIADALDLRAGYANDIRAAGDNDHRQTEQAARSLTPATASDTLMARPPSAQPANPATERQLAYLRDLAETRDLTDEHRAELLRRIDAGEVSKSRASDWITRLKDKPRRPKTVAYNAEGAPRNTDFPEVPAGRYALLEEDGVTRFYRVNRPEEGRWAGFTFLDIQASDDLHPIKDRDRKRAVLAAIQADPAGASKLYGVELGSCGVCGRTLTDETSRAYGIGPVCRERTGW
jgi:Family of unknown function (DUF6011)